MATNVPANFFEPIRHTAITNLLGYLPVLNSRGAVVSPTHLKSDVPMVTYISRQGGSRRLKTQDHEGLVEALTSLEREGLCKLNVVKMEQLGLKAQVEVAAKSTVGFLPFVTVGNARLLFDPCFHFGQQILVGVHGNGLTVRSHVQAIGTSAANVGVVHLA